MGYKPLADISFTELQSLLANLTLITMDNEQVYTINPKGFVFDSGEIELQDPPPEYELINAHMADALIHVDHAALKDYALVCTATPGATAISPLLYDFSNFNYTDWLFLVRFDAEITAPIVFYERKTATVSRMTFGVDVSGPGRYFKATFAGLDGDLEPMTMSYIGSALGLQDFYGGNLLDSWHMFGLHLNPQNQMIFATMDGVQLDAENYPGNFTFTVPAEDELITVGCAGVSIGMIAMSYNNYMPLRKYDQAGPFTPYRKGRIPNACNYYNFTPVPGVTGVKDHALTADYRVNLTLATGATIEEIEII